MDKLKASKADFSLQGNPQSPEDIRKIISQAENGPFHTIQTVKERMAQWKEKYLKSL